MGLFVLPRPLELQYALVVRPREPLPLKWQEPSLLRVLTCVRAMHQQWFDVVQLGLDWTWGFRGRSFTLWQRLWPILIIFKVTA